MMATAHDQDLLRPAPVLVILASLVLGACALTELYSSEPIAEPRAGTPGLEEIDHRLVLLGDAGYARADDPVLRALTEVTREAPGKTTVVYLGDNIYFDGLPPRDHAGYAVAKGRLAPQIDALRGTGARVFFVPGNHDHRAGPDAVPRQAELIADYSSGGARMIPRGACPGPVYADLGQSLRLVAIDTEWLLRGRPEYPCRIEDAGSADAGRALDEDGSFYDRLSSVIGEAGERSVIVVSHHPLATRGPHGGFFTLQEHLFPLTLIPALGMKHWAYVPIPLSFLLYTGPRWAGWLTAQDLSSAAYRRLSSRLRAVFSRHPGSDLVYASGHEHSLQVLDVQLENGSGLLQIVSGAGIIDHHTAVTATGATRMATPHAGFVMLSVRKPEAGEGRHRILLELVEVIEEPDFDPDEAGPIRVRRAFKTWLTDQ